ncbi:DUF4440 domain-containing protein [Silvanigrella paludirubra]|uniref:DUF4440 domain-containing protein n=1 Tax=Silvanigrella paludirubra TaxID=2499159 RepID=A0A6N6VTB1_9BACT|nr:nuclear transport factor 2 family protein [Silvanigrella paludirubra]KAB8037936.1 DUF4440 domain-containing protein [Silvanigrella paludirubra]
MKIFVKLALILTIIPNSVWAMGSKGLHESSEKVVKAVREGKIDDLMAAYSKDAVMYAGDVAKPLKGEEIRKYFTNVFANVELNSKIINPYHEIRGNMVVTWGDYITTIKNKKDNSITTAKGRFTDVAVKENGKWKIIVDHTSPQPEDPKPAN